MECVNVFCVNQQMDGSPESIASFFRELQKRSGLKGNAFARAIGFSGASSVQRYLDPKLYSGGYFRRDLVAKIEKGILGRGTPPITKSEIWKLAGPEFKPQGIIGSFDPDDDDPEAFDGATMGSVTGVRGIPDDASPQVEVTGGMGGGGISIVAEGIPAGHGLTFSAECIRDYWRLPPELLYSLRIRAHEVAIVPVQGDSMFPTLNEGDFVFIDTRHRVPSPPGLYAVIDEVGGLVVKRLEISSEPGADEQNVRVISDNQRHAAKTWRADDLLIVGRVLKKFSNVV